MPKKPRKNGQSNKADKEVASIFLDDDDFSFVENPPEKSSTVSAGKASSKKSPRSRPPVASQGSDDQPQLPVLEKEQPLSVPSLITPVAPVSGLPSILSVDEVPPELDNNFYRLISEQALDQDLLENSDGIPDIVALVDRAIASDFDPSIFTERSFPVATNVIDWCRSPEFLGYNLDLFPRQVQVLAHFFGDVCFFCSDADYIFNVPVKESLGNVLDRFSLLEYGVCPRCRRNRLEIYREWQSDPRFQDYNSLAAGVAPVPYPPNEFVGVWGQRSGKSLLTSTFGVTYILHRYLSLPSPTRYFMEPNNKMFEITFVAPTLGQAEKNSWNPFQHAFYESPWFREVRSSLIEDGKRLGIRSFHSGTTFLAFLSKRLAIHMQAAHGSNLRGATRLIGVIDELGWFNLTEDGKKRSGVRDGLSVLDAVTNSLITVRSKADIRRTSLNDYNALDGYTFLISSPSSISDPIMTKATKAPVSPRMFYTHYKTYEMNPTLTKEFIRTQLARDEESFQRDFCAIPPRAASPFFSDTRLLSELSKFDDLSVKLKYTIEQLRLEGEPLVRLRPVLHDLHSDVYTGRILVVDNGEVNNAFALCIARYLPEIDGLCIEDFMEVTPYRGHSVDLAWCYDKLIVPLVSSFKFLHVCFDRWNSAYAVHDLRTKHGVDAQIYTLKWKDFDQYREDIRGMKVQFPEPEISPDDLLSIKDPALRSRYPRAHFQLQLTTVNLFGNKLLKPDNDNDDLFRISVMANRFLSKYKNEYKELAARMSRRQGAFRSVGVFRGRSNRSVGYDTERTGVGSERSVGFSTGSSGRGVRPSR